MDILEEINDCNLYSYYYALAALLNCSMKKKDGTSYTAYDVDTCNSFGEMCGIMGAVSMLREALISSIFDEKTKGLIISMVKEHTTKELPVTEITNIFGLLVANKLWKLSDTLNQAIRNMIA